MYDQLCDISFFGCDNTDYWATMLTMIPVLMHVLTTTRHSILVVLNVCQVTQLLTLYMKFIIILGTRPRDKPMSLIRHIV